MNSTRVNEIVWFLSAAWLMAALAGCGPSPSAPGPTQLTATNSAAVSNAPPAAPLSAADQLWAELTILASPPPMPEEGVDEPETAEPLTERKRAGGARALGAAELAREFYTRYPEDARVELARDAEHRQLSLALALDNTNALPKLEALETALLANPQLPEPRRVALRIQQLQRAVGTRPQDGVEAALEEMERGARQLRDEFPDRPEVGSLMMTVARGWLETGKSVRSLALVRDVLNANPKGDLKESAETLRRQLERLGQPLELQFTATDGRKVDIAKLKGKVVLIDFWATWCAPCMDGLASLRQLYEDVQPRGLEIIGISFDQDRNTFEQIVQREKITWPQYFEENKSGNRFGEQFGISGIPTFWLIDKQGRLRDLGAGAALRDKIETLLTE